MKISVLHGDQTCLVDDYECTDPGQTHAIRDSDRWKGIALNDPQYCVRCTRRLWFDVDRRTWFALKRVYRIEEEPA